MPIKGITDKLRYQRAGKIYLGIKVKTERVCKCTRDERGQNKAPDKDCRLCLGSGYVYRPKETDYFVLKESQVPELVTLYDPKPKTLNVMLPRAWELEQIFPQNLKLYGASGLKCWGNGVDASFVNPETKALDVKKCPCEFLESGKCSSRAILSFRISELENSMLVYAITTGSYNSILNVNAGLRDLIWFSLSNRVDISDIRLVLSRKAAITQRLDDKSGKIAKSTHYPMFIDLDPDYYDSFKDVITKALPIPASISRPETPQLPAADVTADELAYVDEEMTEEELDKEEPAEKKEPEKKEPEKKTPEQKKPPEKKKVLTPEPVKEAHDKALKDAKRIEKLDEKKAAAEERMDEQAEETMKDIEGSSEAKVDETFEKEEKKISQRDELQQKLNSLIFQCAGLGMRTSKEEQEELTLIRTIEDYEKLIERFDAKLKMRRDKIKRFGHESVMKEEEHEKKQREIPDGQLGSMDPPKKKE